MTNDGRWTHMIWEIRKNDIFVSLIPSHKMSRTCARSASFSINRTVPFVICMGWHKEYLICLQQNYRHYIVIWNEYYSIDEPHIIISIQPWYSRISKLFSLQFRGYTGDMFGNYMSSIKLSVVARSLWEGRHQNWIDTFTSSPRKVANTYKWNGNRDALMLFRCQAISPFLNHRLLLGSA